MPTRIGVPLPGPLVWSPPRGDLGAVWWLLALTVKMFIAGVVLLAVGVVLTVAAVVHLVRAGWRLVRSWATSS